MDGESYSKRKYERINENDEEKIEKTKAVFKNKKYNNQNNSSNVSAYASSNSKEEDNKDNLSLEGASKGNCCTNSRVCTIF